MSIRWKLATMFIALVFLVMIVAGTIIIFSLRIAEEDARREDLALMIQNINAEVIQRNIAAGTVFDEDARADLEDAIRESFAIISGQTPADTEAFIVSGQNRMTLQSTTGSYDPLNHQAIISALGGQEVFSSWRRYPDRLGNVIYWFEFAMPITIDSGYAPDYVIYVRSSAEAFNDRMRDTTGTIAMASVFALLGASVLSIVFAGSLTQNLLRLNKNIKEFKVGAGTEPIPVNIAKDEVGQLTESFNVMSRELNANMAAITSEKNKMEIIMYNMTDGVLAYDEGGVLVHSNYVCEELLGINNIGDMSMRQLFGRIGIEFDEGTFIDNMEDCIINLGEKYINASFNPFKSEDGRSQGIIIVFQDITKHMLLDKMRKDFVANVSHEIRTPLTTIKSYAETLMDGAAEDAEIRDNFLNIINNEADRMAVIIKDLLELSRFDDKRTDFDFDFADLVALVRDNVNQHKLYGDRHNKEITFTSGLVSAHIHMDPERINQVLNNIITNSFRYSGDSAKIEVEIHESGRYYMVYITDNGIGIPKEDLRMVFERFYRVDKARSRELGGTGLGLSIAKEIMEAHGGRISVSSELGVGTTMMLRFPKDAQMADD
ncbi:MAG: cell wall metabolism sensor histidine kinase WalK [Defluviitaleaceae bacterium]|nr:cell wall metabolism sensor histidine kinase WalK [Defluviitaleaceae bacterium]